MRMIEKPIAWARAHKATLCAFLVMVIAYRFVSGAVLIFTLVSSYAASGLFDGLAFAAGHGYILMPLVELGVGVVCYEKSKRFFLRDAPTKLTLLGLFIMAVLPLPFFQYSYLMEKTGW